MECRSEVLDAGSPAQPVNPDAATWAFQVEEDETRFHNRFPFKGNPTLIVEVDIEGTEKSATSVECGLDGPDEPHRNRACFLPAGTSQAFMKALLSTRMKC